MMRGRAALAMWWDMAPAMRDEFEHWHSHEHFPERLALPGFCRASRWADHAAGEGFFVLYELAQWEALASREYVARLNAPTPWSRALMPHHRNMVRSQCRVLESRGGVVAAHALTVRFSARQVRDEDVRNEVCALAEDWHALPGICGVHLLRNDAPAVAPTTEQKIRGLADGAADWILVVTGYDVRTLETIALPAMRSLRGADAQVAGVYDLRLSRTSDAAG